MSVQIEVTTSEEVIDVTTDEKVIDVITGNVTEVNVSDPSGWSEGEIEELAGGDRYYTYSQDVVADTWVINHNLNKYPAVMIVDSAANVVLGDVQYIDKDNLEVSFNSPFSGKAHLN